MIFSAKISEEFCKRIPRGNFIVTLDTVPYGTHRNIPKRILGEMSEEKHKGTSRGIPGEFFLNFRKNL